MCPEVAVTSTCCMGLEGMCALETDTDHGSGGLEASYPEPKVVGRSVAPGPPRIDLDLDGVIGHLDPGAIGWRCSRSPDVELGSAGEVDHDLLTITVPDLSIGEELGAGQDRKSTRLNSSHVASSYAVFCLKKK